MLSPPEYLESSNQSHVSTYMPGPASEDAQEGHAPGGAAEEVSHTNSSSALKQGSQRDRGQQYAELLSGRQQEEAQALLRRVCFSTPWALMSHSKHNLGVEHLAVLLACFTAGQPQTSLEQELGKDF